MSEHWTALASGDWRVDAHRCVVMPASPRSAVLVPSVFALGDAAPKGSGSGMKTTGRALVVEARVGGADKSRFFFPPVIRKRPSRADPHLWGRRGERRAEAKLESLPHCSLERWSLEVARAGRDGSDDIGVAGSSLWEKATRVRSSSVETCWLAGSAAARARSEPERADCCHERD